MEKQDEETSCALLSKKGLPENLQPTVLKDFEAHWSTRQFKTHNLWTNESVLRQPPSKEIDEAWDRITDIGVMHVSRDEVIKLGKDPAITVQAPESWGYGPDRHLVHLDGLHLLHCLNMMRKSLHYNFPYYYPEGVNPMYRPHLSHCLEALVKRLMCQPSIELIGYNWVDKQEHPFPDFDIYHQCCDFEQLLAWQDRHRVKHIEDKWPVFHRKGGAPVAGAAVDIGGVRCYERERVFHRLVYGDGRSIELPRNGLKWTGCWWGRDVGWQKANPEGGHPVGQ